MTTTKDAVTSDTEGQEKPVRKQLQKASISHASGEGLDPATRSEIMEQQAAQNEDDGKPERMDKPPPAELKKKRSFEEIEDNGAGDPPAAHTRSQHTRKRSRDSTAEEDELNNGRKVSGERKRDASDTEGAAKSNGAPQARAIDRAGTPEPKGGKRGEEKVEAMTSPKTKRSRLHSATAEGESGTTPALDEPVKDVVAKDVIAGSKDTQKATSENTRPPSEVKSPSLPSGSGFANTSTTSPFGSVASEPKSPPFDQPQTSASAFAASGFGSLAGAATSGFGALGKTSGGPAGGWGSKKSSTGSEAQNGADKPTSTFGGALGQQSAFGGGGSSGSAFGSSSGGASAFGGNLGGGSAFGGSGFGSLGASAASSGLSSFASGKPSPFASTSSAKTSRPFGAPADEDEDDEAGGEDDDDGAGLKSPLSQSSDKDKQDERFFAQEHETGEEGEETAYSCRAKLYNFAVVDEGKGKKEWKERGLGTLRLNIARGDEGDGEERAKSRARLVMRADGSHRLILNTPVQKDIKFGAASGGPPQSGFILFMGAVDGKAALEMLQLKIKQQFALELYEKIKELQEAM